MYQKIVIVGNLGRNPEMRYLGNGTAVTNFSIASNRSWTDKNSGENVKQTTWFEVSVWGKQAEACNQYLTQGKQVLVEGILQPDPETGTPKTFQRRDGSVGTSYDIKADNVRFLAGKSTNSNQVSSDNEPDWSEDEDNEIPF